MNLTASELSKRKEDFVQGDAGDDIKKIYEILKDFEERISFIEEFIKNIKI